MNTFELRRILIVGCVLAIVAGLGAAPVRAQIRTKERGFDVTLPISPTVEEISLHQDLWALEVTFKPMRMMRVDLTDPKTGRKQPTLVWYLIYKAVNRAVDRPRDDSDTIPVNPQDPLPHPIFVPSFTLVTDDNGVQRIYADTVLLEAQAAIAKRERLPQLKNAVEVVGKLPPAVPAGAKNEQPIFGVVMWRQVESTTDFFTLYMTGFTSSYRLAKDPDGKPLVWRRTIVQEFWRPGDELDEREVEFRRQGDPKWIYRPDDLKAAAQVAVPSSRPKQGAKDDSAPAVEK